MGRRLANILMLDVLSGGATAYAENLRSDALAGARIGVLEELSHPRSKGERREKYCCGEIAAAFAHAVEEPPEETAGSRLRAWLTTWFH